MGWRFRRWRRGCGRSQLSRRFRGIWRRSRRQRHSGEGQHAINLRLGDVSESGLIRPQRHRSRRRRARASATRPEDRVFSAGLAGRTKKPGRLLWLPVDSAPLCSVTRRFRVSMLCHLRFFQFRSLQFRKHWIVGRLQRARGLRLYRNQLDLEMTLTKMTPIRTCGK